MIPGRDFSFTVHTTVEDLRLVVNLKILSVFYAMTYYCIKYWATKGVIIIDTEKDPKPNVEINGKHLLVASKKYAGSIINGRIGADCFLTLEEAQARIEALVKQKVKSLRKQLTEIGNFDSAKVPQVIFDTW